jgi:hypothetical protein
VHQLFLDFKKAYDLVRKEVWHSNLLGFGIPMKLVKQSRYRPGVAQRVPGS